ncbi:MAG: hypothetical protein HY721_25445 [Planctomycetes bacterium]|nr:hypothetical protein [Planctomycetota bacterium]
MVRASRSRPVLLAPVLLPLLSGSLLLSQAPFPDGIEGELYYASRIDRIPAADGGPLVIDLDGILDEAAWQRAPFHTYTEYWKGGQLPQDELDCTPLFACVADGEYLYVAWRIVDDLRNSQSAGCAAFNDDAIELHFDGDGKGIDCGSCGYELNDMQLIIGADQIGKTDPNALEVGWIRNGGCIFAGAPVDNETGLNIISGVVAELDTEDDTLGWQGEIAIALKTATFGEWDVDPVHGTTIGWDVHVDDDDDGDGQDGDDSALIWSKRDGGSQAWQNTGVWGKLQFIAPGKPLVSVVRDIPDDLKNGDSGTVTLTVAPVVGEGVVVINEALPAALVPSSPSAGGTIANNTVTWNLGRVSSEVSVSYTLSPGLDASDVRLPGTVTVDGEPVAIGGDRYYRGSPISEQGFIKLWNHLGPLAWAFPAAANDHGPPGACDANSGLDLPLDWVVNDGETLTEADMSPFPGMIVRPKYGGDGKPGGTGARAAGLAVSPGDTGLVREDRFPIWKAGLSPTDTVDHASAAVNGFDAEDHMTLSCVYVTNKTAADIDTAVGFGSDDAIQILLDNEDVTGGGIVVCRGWGNPNEEQNTAPVTLPRGESRILVKVTDGCCASGFRLRFQDPSDPTGPGLQSPDISVSLESSVNPPPAKVVRSFSKEAFAIGEVIEVSLAVTTPRQLPRLVVTEVLPALVSVSQISHGGAVSGGAIVWNLSNVSAETLTYKLAPGECRTDIELQGSTWEVDPIEALVTGASKLTGALPTDMPLLDPWKSVDIGYEGGAAQPLGEHDVLINALGTGIALANDQLRFTHRPVSGDFEISARIDCLEDSERKGQGGLALRDGLHPAAANISFFITSATAQGGGILKATSRRETNTNKPTTTIALSDTAVPTLPVYIKMARTGSKVTLHRSADGNTYTQIGEKELGTGTSPVVIPSDALAGLAVSGGGAGSARVVFREVSGPELLKVVPPGTLFHRGDSDDNGELQLTDAIRILGYLFLGSVAPSCLEAADADNNGKLELTDAIRILGFLFLGAAAPAPPGPPPADCGLDPPDTGDLGCETYTRCG